MIECGASLKMYSWSCRNVVRNEGERCWRHGGPCHRMHPRSVICENCEATVNLRYIPCPCCGESLAPSDSERVDSVESD